MKKENLRKRLEEVRAPGEVAGMLFHRQHHDQEIALVDGGLLREEKDPDEFNDQGEQLRRARKPVDDQLS